MYKQLNILALTGLVILLSACVSEGEKMGIKWRADIDLDDGSRPATIAPRLDSPRILPVSPETATARQQAMLAPILATDGGRGARNVYGSLISHPDFAEKYSPYGRYILRESSLPPRDRELLILRTGWLNKALYEWEHHRTIGLAAGISAEEIEAIAKGARHSSWNRFDAALLTAADELKADAFISDKTWDTLRMRYTEEQMVDVIATVGNYTFVCMFLNSLGVQLEETEQ